MKDKHAQALGKRGGQARAARLSKEQRSEIARQAAQARWGKTMKYRNCTTGELAPVHTLGTNEEGRTLYQYVQGWEPTFPYTTDEDGNWLAIQD